MKKPVIVWRYSRPNVNGEGWFVAFLDSNGCFTVLSDFGDYSYRWSTPNTGYEDFREFITSCNEGYILSKVARRDEYQAEETLKAVKLAILEERLRSGRSQQGLSKEGAREEWDALEEYERLENETHFARWAFDSGTVLSDVSQLVVYDTPAQARAFMKHVWPKLKTDIDMEISVYPFAAFSLEEDKKDIEIQRLKEKNAQLKADLYKSNNRWANLATENMVLEDKLKGKL